MKEKELDVLQARIKKADKLFETNSEMLPLSQIEVYLNLVKLEYVLKNLKFLVSVTPISMNPEKSTEHFKYTVNFLKSLSFVENKISDELISYINGMKTAFDAFKSENVNSYQKFIANYIKGFIILWKSRNNYK